MPTVTGQMPTVTAQMPTLTAQMPTLTGQIPSTVEDMQPTTSVTSAHIPPIKQDPEETTQTIFVNEQGQQVNEQGQLINEQGQAVNEQGQEVNEQGQVVIEQGQQVVQLQTFEAGQETGHTSVPVVIGQSETSGTHAVEGTLMSASDIQDQNVQVKLDL